MMSFCRNSMARAIAAMCALALCGAASPLSAQVTSASVAGVVKDAQGGVIPGATVVLISETLGTSSSPVVTGGTGDFVFPTVKADSYTVEVTMSGFKTLRRTGLSVSPGDRVAIGALTIEVGGALTSAIVSVFTCSAGPPLPGSIVAVKTQAESATSRGTRIKVRM